MIPPFLQYLIQQKALTAAVGEKLAALFSEGKQSLDELLLEEKFNEQALLARKAEFYNLPPVDFNTQTVEPSLLEIFSKETVVNYQIIPFALDEETVHVAIVNPENLKAREAVDFMARQKGWNTRFYVTTVMGLRQALDKYRSMSSEVEEALAAAEEGKAEKTAAPAKEGELEEVVKSAPISKMVSVIFRHAVEGGASDIHIEPSEGDSRVRYRIDGALHTTLTFPRHIHSSIISRIKVMANLKLDETRRPQDGRIRLTFAGKQIDFRVSTLPLMNSEKVVMRILDVTRGAPKLPDLGFTGRNLAVIERGIHEPHGLFLVTGPTGSGKSTTLFSALSLLNDEEVNIVTLEDPVEYYLAGSNQALVRPEVGFTFASGLRSILRQDPDVIMVGEIRDNETAALAVQAALTGHIVLSTLHTNDALGAVPRLVDMKVEPFLLSSTINVILAQRLVRKLCQACRQETALTPDLQQAADKIFAAIAPAAFYAGVSADKRQFWKAVGCAKCGESGYKGRLSVSEVLENTKTMADIVAHGFGSKEVAEELARQGFISMAQDGIMKAALGLTTVEEVVMATKD